MGTSTPTDFSFLLEHYPHLEIGRAPRHPLLGGQNFTYCCLKALNQYFQQGNSSEVQVASWVLWEGSQFPCGAQYAGNDTGVPEVRASYDFAARECPGWELSHSQNLSQWLQPLVGFILPAVIFSLNVPRRRRLNLPPWLFPQDIDTFRGGIAAAAFAIAAITIAITDTVLWLLAVFAACGPLLLSGLHEAWVDQKLMAEMRKMIEDRQLPIAIRVRVFAATLVGNLDMDTAWDGAMSLADKVEDLNVPFRVVPDDIHNAPSDAVYKIQSRLRSMLECQYSFGFTIGAPVAFYLGSFIFAVREIRSTLGDNDSGHALAFGLWWMAIPLVAMVSGCLLGGNNPNTLEGIVAADHRRRHDEEHGLRRLFRPTYDAVYRPAWMWYRGRSKKKWITEVCKVYREKYTEPHRHDCPPTCSRHARKDVAVDLADIERATSMNKGDWCVLAFFALLLLSIPSFLGFVLAFYTPQVGLSCRSMTFGIYACSQAWLIFVWLYDLHVRINVQDCLQRRSVPPFWERYAYLAAMSIGFAAAIFTAIGGTLMQILGVYRNAKCKLNIQSWPGTGSGRKRTFRLSTNNAIDIYEARHNWTWMGAAGIAFLGVVCYLGWWYQRRLRSNFRALVDMLDTCKPSGGIGATSAPAPAAPPYPAARPAEENDEKETNGHTG